MKKEFVIYFISYIDVKYVILKQSYFKRSDEGTMNKLKRQCEKISI